MSKQLDVINIRFALSGVMLLMAGCSQFSQPPAPIESGLSRPAVPVAATPARAQAAPDASPAVTTPVRTAPVIRPDATEKSNSSSLGDSRAATHVVAPGETLYRIARNSGRKYQDLASWNHLPNDYSITIGQTLRLTPPENGDMPPVKAPVVAAGKAATPPAAATSKAEAAEQAIEQNGASSPAAGESKAFPKALKLPYSAAAAKKLPALSEGQNSAPPAETRAPIAADTGNTSPAPANKDNQPGEASAPATTAAPKWIWPTEGKVLEGFSNTNKGLDISGKLGQPVLAVADGSVVYSGTGLRGYGKLIIIKHDKTFLTAYAHNNQILVKEGQRVKQGQKIAEMGSTDAERVKLHFEVRRFGKPVDPTQYLDKQS